MILRRSERRRGAPEMRGGQLSAAELALIASCGERIRNGDWTLIRSVGLEQVAQLRHAASVAGPPVRRCDSRSATRLVSSLWLLASAVTSVVLWRRKRKTDDTRSGS